MSINQVNKPCSVLVTSGCEEKYVRHCKELTAPPPTFRQGANLRARLASKKTPKNTE